jgi:hypothetical protein
MPARIEHVFRMSLLHRPYRWTDTVKLKTKHVCNFNSQMVRTKVAPQRARILSHCIPCGRSSSKIVFGNLSQPQMSQTLALVWASFHVYLAVSLLSAFPLHIHVFVSL